MPQTPDSLRVEDRTVQVHVVGPGYGECVLIIIGKRIVLGIDSCSAAAPTDDAYVKRIVGALKSPYILWVLTHCHFDHFQGLTTILDGLGLESVRQIVVPLEYRRADLQFDLANDAAHDLGDCGYHVARGEYARLRRFLARPGWQECQTSHTGNVVLIRKKLLPRVGHAVMLTVSIESLTPTALGNSLGRAQRPGWRDEGNHGSYILHIECGGFRGQFRGDAPADRDLGVRSGRALDVLKVAHHGAPDGTSPSLLERLAPIKKGAIAAIAPFDKHRLPVDSVKSMLTHAGFEVKVAGRVRDTSSLSADVRVGQQWTMVGVRSRVRVAGRLDPVIIKRRA